MKAPTQAVFVPLTDALESALHDAEAFKHDALSALGDLVPFQLDIAPVFTYENGVFTLAYPENS